MAKSIDLTDLIEVDFLQTSDNLPNKCDPKAAIHVSVNTHNFFFLTEKILSIMYV